MRKLSFSIFAAAVIALIALPGCYPPKKGGAAPKTTLTVDASCDFASGSIELMPGDLVQICNDNDCMVTIVFENKDLFGRRTIRLAPGECINLHVRKGAAGHDYLADMDCESCGTGGGHTTPEFKVGGGGP